MNRKNKMELRSTLFRHLDGIAIAPTVSALQERGITNFIQDNPHFTFQGIHEKFETNSGYLNVALRILASQGWLIRNILQDGEEIEFELTDKGREAFSLAPIYTSFCKFIPVLIELDRYLFDPNARSVQENLQNLIEQYRYFNQSHSDPNSVGWEIARHLEGIITGPILVALGMSEYFSECLENDGLIDEEMEGEALPLISSVMDFFLLLNWLETENGQSRFTDEGLFFLRRSAAYGVTVSYLPTFNHVPVLLYDNPNIIWKRTPEGLETHVNRRMNVWGSGGAHSLYFRKIDEIIIHIFNQPLNDQPIGIADMGCGDGTLLMHLHNVVKNQTERGKHLNIYPLKIIGADFNKAARLASSITLKEAGIEHSILHGDISSPSAYAENLQDQYHLDLRQMLNVRSFLDHNRIYSPPKKPFHDRICNSTGAFAFRGRWIPNNELKQNLVEHFAAWTKYVNKYGLLILELHTVNPKLTAENLGKTTATAYDGTHGYSDQYIFEVDVVLEAAKEAGLIPDPQYQARFPNDELATISINLFQAGS